MTDGSNARRPTQLLSSHSSLRIELCVIVFIGRSPTQLLLCHRSIEESKPKPAYF